MFSRIKITCVSQLDVKLVYISQRQRRTETIYVTNILGVKVAPQIQKKDQEAFLLLHSFGEINNEISTYLDFILHVQTKLYF